MFKSFLCVLFAILYAVAVDARDQGIYLHTYFCLIVIIL